MKKFYRFLLVDRFRAIWRQLADAGLCDGLDGADYRRVIRDWLLHKDRQLGIKNFILEHANKLEEEKR